MGISNGPFKKVNQCRNTIYPSDGPKAVCVYDENHDGVHSWAEEFKGNQDIINHPEHYTGHPSGVECIDVTEHMNFCLGNAIKYIWRADSKDNPIENLKKAIWYLKREITRRQNKES